MEMALEKEEHLLMSPEEIVSEGSRKRTEASSVNVPNQCLIELIHLK